MITFLASSASIHSHKWINYFANRGFKIRWISLHAKLNDTKIDDNIDYHEFANDLRLVNFLKASVLLLKLSRNEGLIIHSHYIGIYGFLGLFIKKKYWIMTVWGSDVLLATKNFLKRFIIKKVLIQSDIITYDAEHILKKISHITNESLDFKCLKIEFGVDLRKFNYKPKLSAEEFVIISLRNHESIYDIETLIYALYELKNMNCVYRAIVAGVGSETKNIKKLIDTLKLNSEVHCTGAYKHQDLPKILQNTDVYVSTSHYDAGLASSTAEAMACGIPVVVTDVMDNRRYIDDGVNGFLFEKSNSMQLARILYHLKDNVHRREIGLMGRKRISEVNDLNVAMKPMLKIYRDLNET